MLGWRSSITPLNSISSNHIISNFCFYICTSFAKTIFSIFWISISHGIIVDVSVAVQALHAAGDDGICLGEASQGGEVLTGKLSH